MFMTLTNWECQCPANMHKFGDSCILQSVFDEQVSNIELEADFYKMVYNDVEKANGQFEELPVSQTSDVIEYYFVESFIGCKLDRDP